MTFNKLICGAALLAAACWANTASAYGPYFYGGYYGCNGLGFRCTTIRDFSVPYYAFYPPVYYAESVARPYGYSPFAYPPGYQTPSGIASSAEPVTIRNAYATGEAAPPDAAGTGPKRIKNPFVAGGAARRRASGSLSAPVAEPSEELETLQPPPFR